MEVPYPQSIVACVTGSQPVAIHVHNCPAWGCPTFVAATNADLTRDLGFVPPVRKLARMGESVNTRFIRRTAIPLMFAFTCSAFVFGQGRGADPAAGTVPSPVPNININGGTLDSQFGRLDFA